ncbi:hypothetical protein X777_12801, partial [Ooceraea biroi]
LRLVENGSFSVSKHDAGRLKSVSTPEVELEVLRRVEENPNISIRIIATELHMNASLVWRILRERVSQLSLQNFLNETYNNWIGRGGPVPWPPRSPDFNPLDFCIWGYLKSLVYSRPINNVDDLRHRVEDVCQAILQIPGTFERIRVSFLRRCEVCVQIEGGHVEHLL